MKSTFLRSTRAFTLIELLVSIAIIAVVAAIIFPVFSNVREQARRTTCLSNVRQITVALTNYTQDNAGFFPPTITSEGDWAESLLSYAPAKDIFWCPSCPVPSEFERPVQDGWPADIARGYALNVSFYDLSSQDSEAISEADVRFPASTVALCEFGYRRNTQNGGVVKPTSLSGPDDGTELMPNEKFIGSSGATRHQGGSNYSFVDGHTQWQQPALVKRANQGNDGHLPSFAL